MSVRMLEETIEELDKCRAALSAAESELLVLREKVWEARNELSDVINTWKGQGISEFDMDLHVELNRIDDLFIAAMGTQKEHKG